MVRGDLDRVRGDLDGVRGDLDGVTDVLAEVRDEQKTLAKRDRKSTRLNSSHRP